VGLGERTKNLSFLQLLPSGAQFVRMLMAAESGVCDELCCPYTGDWKPCPDYRNRLTAISSYKTLYRADLAKAHIANAGPVMAGMEVYTDFFDYDGGIYSQEYGDFVRQPRRFDCGL
jgi:hypothetical protein